MNKVKLVAYVSLQQRDALQKLHEKSGAPIAELVRRFIDAGLKAEQKGGSK